MTEVSGCSSLTLDMACDRKFHRGDATFARLRLKRQMSAQSLRKQVGEEGAEAHPLAGFLRRKEWFENTFHNFRRHPNTAVANGESQGVRSRKHFQDNRLALRAGVDCVFDKRRQGLQRGLWGKSALGKVRLHLNMDSFLLRGEPCAEACNQIVNIQLSGCFSQGIRPLRSHTF